MHDNGGMNMDGYGFAGMHVFWWITITVIIIGVAIMLSRLLKRK